MSDRVRLARLDLILEDSGRYVVCDYNVNAGFGSTAQEAFEDYDQQYGDDLEGEVID